MGRVVGVPCALQDGPGERLCLAYFTPATRWFNIRHKVSHAKVTCLPKDGNLPCCSCIDPSISTGDISSIIIMRRRNRLSMDGIVIINRQMAISCVALTLARAVVLTLDDPHPAGRHEPQSVHHGIYTDSHGGWAFFSKGAGGFGASITSVACGDQKSLLRS